MFLRSVGLAHGALITSAYFSTRTLLAEMCGGVFAALSALPPSRRRSPSNLMGSRSLSVMGGHYAIWTQVRERKGNLIFCVQDTSTGGLLLPCCQQPCLVHGWMIPGVIPDISGSLLQLPSGNC